MAMDASGRAGRGKLRPVAVKGSDEVEFQGMVVVLDTLQQLEITNVGRATQ